MKLKRFVAPSTAKAMRKIKETFGEEAVILSSHTVKEGVEVVAAVDYDESVIHGKTARDLAEPVYASQSVIPSDSSKDPSVLDVLQNEMRCLREMVENQLAGFAMQNMAHYQPMQMLLIKRLIKLGFDINFSTKLVKKIEESKDSQKAWLVLLTSVMKELLFFNHELLQTGGVYAFVGPTGVGKTTTIAKLAARFCLQFGNDQLGLITTDNYRIAAVEQLITYGKILGITVSVAHDAESLQTNLNKLKDKKLVLIDTAGMKPSDSRVHKQFEMLKQMYVPVSPILVFSATSQYSVLEDIFNHYFQGEIESCIMTKLDESKLIGASLSMLAEKKIPLTYLTHGQRVPEDIEVASANSILKRLIDSQDPANKESDVNELIVRLSGRGAYA